MHVGGNVTLLPTMEPFCASRYASSAAAVRVIIRRDVSKLSGGQDPILIASTAICRHDLVLGPPLEQDGPWHTAAVGDANVSRQPLVKLTMHPILQVAKVGAFTSQQVTELSSQVDELQQRAAEASPGSKEALTKVRHCDCVGTCQKWELHI
jgi:hypothetical protein